MKTSTKGRAALRQEEGDVLKAYRDIVGRWTISMGLTAASGVVKPKAGMVITADESDRLVSLALERNYEPAVAAAMKAGNPQQHEFDAGVSFHWNTGAIGRASWVGHWVKKSWLQAEKAFKLWNKAGGKVVPGLVNRRAREYDMLHYGIYPAVIAQPSAAPARYAPIAAPVTAAQVPALRKALADLGYVVGVDPERILYAALRQFQRDHDLTPDGILGRATATTIQRRIDAGKKGETAAAVSTSGVAGGSAEIASGTFADQMPWLGPVLIAAAIAWALWVAWQYRDALAAKVQSRLPRFAAYLRSF